MEVVRFAAAFGAEVIGLDLGQPLDAERVAAVNRAFVDSTVLCFRDQHFDTPDAFLAAARNLGEPMPPVTATYRLPGYEVIEELSNRATDRRTGDTRPLNRGGTWHTDHSNLAAPPKATVLYAIEVPQHGGNTEFTSLIAAYEALDATMKARLRGRRVFEAYLSRRAPRKLLTRTAEEEEGSSGTWQPLLRRHPESGRTSLYFNPMRDEAVEGLSQDEGDALLDALYAHCDQPRFQYSHRWRPGDMLIWDNRCALHQARFDFDPSLRRYLHRIMLRGEPAQAAG
jgi:taurine dioxygenase